MLRGWCSAYVGQPHTCTAHARRDWVRALTIFGYLGSESALVALDLRVGKGCCRVIMAARARDVSGGGQKYDYPPHIAHVWAPTHRAHHLCSKLNFPVRRPCPKIFFC